MFELLNRIAIDIELDIDSVIYLTYNNVDILRSACIVLYPD